MECRVIFRNHQRLKVNIAHIDTADVLIYRT